jgi:hypothetical protein
VKVKGRKTPHLIIPCWGYAQALAGIITNSIILPGKDPGTIPI